MDKNIIIERFYKDHKDRVYNFIARLVARPEQAIDLTLQTFVTALNDKNVVQIANPKTYLFSIARNILYSEIDQEVKPENTPKDNSQDNTADENATNPETVTQQEKTSELQEIQNKVKQAINCMSAKTKELMILRYTEEHSFKEISVITGRTISDVKVNLHRSKIRFESAFSDEKTNNVDISHETCNPLATLFAPHKDTEIPEPHLQLIDKHISKCFLCFEDQEKLQHSKILFNIDPLIKAPKIFDKKINDAIGAKFKFLAKIAKPPKKTASIKSIGKKAAVKVVTATTMSTIKATKIGFSMVAGIIGILVLFTLFNDDTETANYDDTATTADIDPFVKSDLSALVNLKAKDSTTGQYINQKLLWEVYSEDTVELIESNTTDNFDLSLNPGKYYVTVKYQGKSIKSPFEIKDDTSVNIELNFNLNKKKVTALDVSKLPNLHIHRKTTNAHKSLQPRLSWDNCVENIEMYLITRDTSPTKWRKRERQIKIKQPNFKLNRGIATEPDWSALTQNVEDEYFSGEQHALYRKGSNYEILNDGSCTLIKTNYNTAEIDDGQFKYYIDYIKKTADKTISERIIAKGVQAMSKMLKDSMHTQQHTEEHDGQTNVTLIAGTESVIGESCEYTFKDEMEDMRHCYWKTMHQYPAFIRRKIILKTTKKLNNKQSFFGKTINVATLFEKDIPLSKKVFSVPSNININDTSAKDLRNLKNSLTLNR